MDLNLRLVRYFVAVADAGTFTKAAEQLHIATPSLSQQVRKLEVELGVSLLERDHRGARLTAAGQDFLEESRVLLTAAESAIGAARRHQRSSSGKMHLGFLAGGAGELTRPIVDEFQRREPEVELELTQLAWGDELSALTSGRVDIVVARPPLESHPRLRRVVLFEEPRVLLMAHDHPLARRRKLRIADLADVVQVDTREGTRDWRNWWSIDPRPDGTRPTYGPRVNSVEEMVQVVATTDAVAITGAGVASLFRRAETTSRLIADAAPSTVELVFLASDMPSAVERFVAVAVELSAVLGAR